jgi:hypothetical protein
MDLKDLSDDQKCNLEKEPSHSFFKFNTEHLRFSRVLAQHSGIGKNKEKRVLNIKCTKRISTDY